MRLILTLPIGGGLTFEIEPGRNGSPHRVSVGETPIPMDKAEGMTTLINTVVAALSERRGTFRADAK